MTYVLFSGGLDSWICLNWASARFGPESVRAIYFDFGQQYAEKEISSAQFLCGLVGVKLILRRDLLGILQENKVTGFIPFRNTMLLVHTAALPNAERVVFGALWAENAPDKQPEYLESMREVLRDQRESGTFTIETPLDAMTKRQAVQWARKRYGYLFATGIPHTISCYGDSILACSSCMSCWNRWVALYPETTDNRPAEWMLSKMSEQRPETDWRNISLVDRLERGFEWYRTLNRYTREFKGRRLVPYLWQRRHQAYS